jgi:hypothetical protein
VAVKCQNQNRKQKQKAVPVPVVAIKDSLWSSADDSKVSGRDSDFSDLDNGSDNDDATSGLVKMTRIGAWNYPKNAKKGENLDFLDVFGKAEKVS